MDSFYRGSPAIKFFISKIYINETEMNNDNINNVQLGDYILIETLNPNDPTNGNIYQKIDIESDNIHNKYKYICNVQGLPAKPPEIKTLTEEFILQNEEQQLQIQSFVFSSSNNLDIKISSEEDNHLYNLCPTFKAPNYDFYQKYIYLDDIVNNNSFSNQTFNEDYYNKLLSTYINQNIDKSNNEDHKYYFQIPYSENGLDTLSLEINSNTITNNTYKNPGTTSQEIETNLNNINTKYNDGKIFLNILQSGNNTTVSSDCINDENLEYATENEQIILNWTGTGIYTKNNNNQEIVSCIIPLNKPINSNYTFSLQPHPTRAVDLFYQSVTCNDSILLFKNNTKNIISLGFDSHINYNITNDGKLNLHFHIFSNLSLPNNAIIQIKLKNFKIRIEKPEVN